MLPLEAIRSLTTKRCDLRPIQHGDALAIFQAYGNDPLVARYMSWRYTGDIRDTEAFVRFAADRWLNESDDLSRYDYAVLLRSTGELIGAFGAAAEGEAFQRVCVGYNYGRKWWGQGIATEVLGAMTAALLARPKVFRVWAVHDLDNPASGRVMEKCGYQFEGILRAWSIIPNVSDEPRDSACYAKVKNPR